MHEPLGAPARKAAATVRAKEEREESSNNARVRVVLYKVTRTTKRPGRTAVPV